jgi:tRNA A37 threonylcarbamoyltransferase TsaD
MGGPAAVAGALRVLDRHTRTIVKHGLSQQSIAGPSLAEGVGEQHDHVARLLQELSLEHGTEAMSTAAEYAAVALEAGSLYVGEELDSFLRDVAGSVRATSKELT